MNKCCLIRWIKPHWIKDKACCPKCKKPAKEQRGFMGMPRWVHELETECEFQQWFEKEYVDERGAHPDVEINGIKYPIFDIDDLVKAFEAGRFASQSY